MFYLTGKPASRAAFGGRGSKHSSDVVRGFQMHAFISTPDNTEMLYVIWDLFRLNDFLSPCFLNNKSTWVAYKRLKRNEIKTYANELVTLRMKLMQQIVMNI